MADTDTNPGTRSAAEIEREVDADRRKVSDTIDALQDRMSIGNIVDQVARTLGEHGGEAGRNLGRTVRDNPIPVLLTGVGLAWLMAGGGGPRVSGTGAKYDRDELWDDDLDDFDDDPLFSPLPPEPMAAAGLTDEGAPVVAGHGEADSDSPGLGARARDAASSVGTATGDAARRTGDRARAAADRARMRGRRARHGTANMARNAQQGLDRMIQDQPLAIGALALALGAAAGGALPRSRSEDELFGAESDRVKGAARDVAEQEGAKLRATADAVAGEAAAIVDESAGEIDRSTPGGADMVDRAGERVEDAARRLRDAGRDEAERQDLGRSSSADRTGP